ncbi:MAG: flagellin [Planctomycetota bacterium]
MGSILTNNSAMVALQTLNSINRDLSEVQSQISTGLKVGAAKDSAAVFAISQVMKSDVQGFQALSESLSLGSSTLAVASNAASSVNDVLNEIKTKIVSANEENVDRQALQDEITSLSGQISSIVSAAQFNGLNLVDGSVTGGQISILSSLDRDSEGVVSTNSIAVSTQNLSTTAGATLAAAAFTVTDGGGTANVIDASGGTIVVDTAAFQGGNGALAPDNTAAVTATATALLAGDEVSVTVGSVTANYIVQEGDTLQSLVVGINDDFVAKGLNPDIALDLTTAEELTITNNTNEAVAFSFEATRGTGALAGLNTIDVTTGAGAATALNDIETMIQSVIDAQAAFGTAENRVEIQADFMSNLIDSFKSGIGTLVDADLEEASARLQALQVQQQLGTQALSIANQAPQSILALFR